MKLLQKIIFIIIAMLGQLSLAQDIEKWHELTPQQQKEILEKLSPKEKMELFRRATLEEVVHSLKIPQDKIPYFSEVYSQYQLEVHAVKEAYPMRKNIEEISEEEAQKILDNSFIVGRKLLEIRKEYAKKFQQIISAKKVLQLFRYEGSIRKKIMEKKEHHNKNKS